MSTLRRRPAPTRPARGAATPGAFFELVPEPLAVASADGRFLHVNRAWQAVLGWTPAEMVGRPFLDFVHPDDLERTLAEAARIFAGDGAQPRFRNRYRTRDGGWRWLEWSTEFGADGACYCAARDVTEQHEAEQSLRERNAEKRAALAEAEALFRATFEQAAVGIAHVGLDGAWLRVNQRLCTFLGYDEATLRLLTFQDITHPDDLDADLDLLRRVLAGKLEHYALEKRYRRRDGRFVWGRLTVSLRRDDAGGPLHFISIVEDAGAKKDAEFALQRANAELEARIEERTQALAHANRTLSVEVEQRREAEARLRDSEARMRGVLEHSHDAFVAMDEDGVVTDWNRSAEAVFGWRRSEALGRRMAELIIPPGLRDAHEAGLQRVLATGHGSLLDQRMQLRAMHRSGRDFPVEVTISQVKAGGRRLFTAFLHDISERVASERALAENERRLRTITDNVPALIAYVDRDFRFRFANAAFRGWYGVDPDASLGRTVAEFRGEDAWRALRPATERALAGERVSFQRTDQRPDGTQRHTQTELIPDIDAEGCVRGVHVMAVDISEHKRAEQVLEQRALRDELTGLPNRAAWNAELERGIARARRAGTPLMLMFLDLDGFKQVNDRHGHDAGDAVLREFAARLQGALRRSDVIARLAGDEFVVLLDNVNDVEGDPPRVAAKILAAVADGCLFRGERLAMTPSIGIAVHRGGRPDAARLMRRADEAMYAAKRSGDRHYAICED